MKIKTKVKAGGIYTKVEGLDGEAKDVNHDKWIDVLS
jgi:hypothetical protein